MSLYSVVARHQESRGKIMEAIALLSFAVVFLAWLFLPTKVPADK